MLNERKESKEVDRTNMPEQSYILHFTTKKSVPVLCLLWQTNWWNVLSRGSPQVIVQRRSEVEVSEDISFLCYLLRGSGQGWMRTDASLSLEFHRPTRMELHGYSKQRRKHKSRGQQGLPSGSLMERVLQSCFECKQLATDKAIEKDS